MTKHDSFLEKWAFYLMRTNKSWSVLSSLWQNRSQTLHAMIHATCKEYAKDNSSMSHSISIPEKDLNNVFSLRFAQSLEGSILLCYATVLSIHFRNIINAHYYFESVNFLCNTFWHNNFLNPHDCVGYKWWKKQGVPSKCQVVPRCQILYDFEI